MSPEYDDFIKNYSGDPNKAFDVQFALRLECAKINVNNNFCSIHLQFYHGIYIFSGISALSFLASLYVIKKEFIDNFSRYGFNSDPCWYLLLLFCLIEIIVIFGTFAVDNINNLYTVK